MADVKISQLPAATTPLDGTEVLPIVQSATTKQVSIANVTAGRAMSATSLTLTTPLAVTSGGTGLSTTGAGTFLVSATADTVSATATPSLGVASTTSGTLRLFNSASASGVTIASGNNAGAWTLTLPTSGGTNGYILTTNGSGVSSWTNPTALGVDLDVGSTAITGGTTTRILYDNAGVLGEYAVTGTGTTAVLSTSPNLSGNVTVDSATFSPSSPSTNGNLALTGTVAMGSSFLRNRIINGDMRIDQRNAGASYTPPGSALSFSLDRWCFYPTQASKLTTQQNAGSVTPPVGFTNYLGVTSSSAYSVTSTDTFEVFQPIEGLNVADLAWGTASAATVTLSFWVRSSLTGTFGGSLCNGANNRSYPFTYTINSANTWELKAVTIAGDTTGTWATNNTLGIAVRFGLGSGSTFSATAGSWASGNYVQPTGTVSVVGTNGATFYITGVQLEVGSVATPFERRQYGTELMLCQRYLPAYNFDAANQSIGAGLAPSTSSANIVVIFSVPTRTAPTGVSVTGNFNALTANGNNSGNFTSISLLWPSKTGSNLNCTGGSGLTQGQGTMLLSPTGTSQILFTGCEL